MPQLVVGALQKRAVHTKDWLGARARKRGGKGHGVLLGNAHIDELFAGGSAKLGCKAHDVGCGGRDAHDLRIALDGGAERLARNVGVGARRRLARMARAELAAGRHVKGAYVMPALGVVLGRLKALALGGGDVQHDGMIDIAQFLQRIDEGQHVVTGVQIAVVEPHRAENVALTGAVAGAQLGQIAIEAAMVLGNGLVVIVDDDDQVAIEFGGIVKALKRQAARKRAVANDGDDVVRIARQVASVR